MNSSKAQSGLLSFYVKAVTFSPSLRIMNRLWEEKEDITSKLKDTCQQTHKQVKALLLRKKFAKNILGHQSKIFSTILIENETSHPKFRPWLRCISTCYLYNSIFFQCWLTKVSDFPMLILTLIFSSNDCTNKNELLLFSLYFIEANNIEYWIILRLII